MTTKRGPTPAGQRVHGCVLQRGVGQPLDPNYDGTRQYTWTEITRLINAQEDKPLCRQTLMRHMDNTIIKIRKMLLEDPVIRDWLIDNNLEEEWFREPEDVSMFSGLKPPDKRG